MEKIIRMSLIGAGIGALSATLLAIPGLLPAAVAREPAVQVFTTSLRDITAPPGFNAAGLVRVADASVIDVSASAAPAPQQGVVTIHKIGFGHSTFVTVTENSGAYVSSDALASGHVLYPGVAPADSKTAGPVAQVALKLGENGWVTLELQDAGSFLYLEQPDGALISGDFGTCLALSGRVTC